MIDAQIKKGEDFDITELGNSFDAYRDVGWDVDINQLMGHFDNINRDKVKSGTLNNEVNARINQMRNETSSVQDNIDRMRERYGQTALVNANIFKRDGMDLVGNENLFDHNKDLAPGKDVSKNGKPYIKSVLSALLGSGFNPNDLPKPDVSDTLDKQSNLSEELIANGVRKALYANGQGDLASILKDAKSASNSTDRDNTLEPVVNQIYEQLKENNLKPEIEMILMWLEDLALYGIKTSAEGSDEAGGSAAGGSGYFGRAGAALKRSMGSIGRNSLAFGKKAKGHIQKNASRLFGLIQRVNPLKVISDTATTMYHTGKGFVKGLLGDFDIYDADGKIVFIGKWLKEGKYFNSDGTVIKKISDLKGAVYDASGKVLISWDELKDKIPGLQYFNSTGWKKLSEQFGSILGRVAGAPGKWI
jgi:hypothetical protein